jgi:hypothetical protein
MWNFQSNTIKHKWAIACQKKGSKSTNTTLGKKLKMILLCFCSDIIVMSADNSFENLKKISWKLRSVALSQAKKSNFGDFDFVLAWCQIRRKTNFRLFCRLHVLEIPWKFQNCSLNIFGEDRGTRQGGSKDKKKRDLRKHNIADGSRRYKKDSGLVYTYLIYLYQHYFPGQQLQYTTLEEALKD